MPPPSMESGLGKGWSWSGQIGDGGRTAGGPLARGIEPTEPGRDTSRWIAGDRRHQPAAVTWDRVGCPIKGSDRCAPRGWGTAGKAGSGAAGFLVGQEPWAAWAAAAGVAAACGSTRATVSGPRVCSAVARTRAGSATPSSAASRVARSQSSSAWLAAASARSKSTSHMRPGSSTMTLASPFARLWRPRRRAVEHDSMNQHEASRYRTLHESKQDGDLPFLRLGENSRKENEYGESPHRARGLARRVHQWAERRP